MQITKEPNASPCILVESQFQGTHTKGAGSVILHNVLVRPPAYAFHTIRRRTVSQQGLASIPTWLVIYYPGHDNPVFPFLSLHSVLV